MRLKNINNMEEGNKFLHEYYLENRNKKFSVEPHNPTDAFRTLLPEHDLDSIFYESETGSIAFEPLSRVLNYTPLFRLISCWICAAVNAHRTYVTGRDH